MAIDPDDWELTEQQGAPSAPSLSAPRVWRDREKVERFLREQTVDTLSRWLMQTADEESEWRRRLLLRSKLDDADNVNEQKKWLTSVIGKPSRLDKRRLKSYVPRQRLLLELFALLAEQQKWADLSVLCEHALQRLFAVYVHADDSEQELAHFCAEVLELHRLAAKFMQQPELLGAQVARLLVRAPEGIMHLDAYLPLLGERGQQRFGASLELLWQAMQIDDVRQSSTTNQTTVRSLLMHWYLHQGRVDDWLTLKQQENWLPETVREVAQTLRDAQRIREAIQVLEQGIRQYPDAFAIRKLLVDAYLQDGLQEEATDMLWQQFLLSPTAQHYTQLLAVLPEAEKPRWREKALQHAEHVEAKINAEHGGLPYRGVQLAIWIAEGNDDEALAIARQYRCDAVAIEALAMRLEQTRQEDAAQLHQQLLQREIERPSTVNFDDAFDRLHHLHSVLSPMVFWALLTRLRLKYASNRKFIQLLNQTWSPYLDGPHEFSPTA